MPAPDSFLDAIRAVPDDDGPRLIYADWLDEQGDPHRAALAEFIRVQIALAAAPPYSSDRETLAVREAALATEHRDSWEAPLRALGVQVSGYRRGFATTVEFSTPYPAPKLNEIVAAAPGLSGVWFHGSGALLRSAWLQKPAPFRVLELSVRGSEADGFHRQDAEALARSPWLEEVEQLSLRPYRDSFRSSQQAWYELEPILRAVSRRSNRRLRSLDAAGNWRHWHPAISEIYELALFDQIETLDLSRNTFDADLPNFLSACRLPSLRTLILRGAAYDPQETLPIPPHVLRSLTALDLSQYVRDELAGMLTASREHLSSLTSLDLARTLLTADRLPAFPADFRIDSLVRLRLDNNYLNHDGAQALADLEICSTLRELGLAYNVLTDADVRTLIADDRFAQLHTLDVRGNRLTASDKTALLQSPRRAGLSRLDV